MRPASLASKARRAARSPGEPVGEDGGASIAMLPPFEPVAPFAVALGRAGAQQKGGEPLVELPALAHPLAAVEDRHRDAVDRAGHGRVLQPPDGAVHRCVPSQAERLRTGPPPERVGGVAAHAHGLDRLVHAAAAGKLFDEGELLVGNPAVVAVADRDRAERGAPVWPAAEASGPMSDSGPR